MNREEVKNKLKEKYNEMTSEVLSECIIDFERLFKGKYRTIEENIELLFKNIPKGIIVYDEPNGHFDATCSLTKGEFMVDKAVLENNDYFRYTFFHEFLHAISYKEYNGLKFCGFCTLDQGGEARFKSEQFNEAFTEFMTLKRNEFYNYGRENGSLSGYDVGAHELILLTKIIPEEELINSYFNNPIELKDIFTKYNMNMDEIFYAIHILKERDEDVYALSTKRGLRDPQMLFKVIDGSRYFFYNLLDYFGKTDTKEKFDRKWNILLSEINSKYDFYKVDGIFRYGELARDIYNLKIEDNDPIFKRIPVNIYKFRYLDIIFNNEDKMKILERLYEIYAKDYREYADLVLEDPWILPYTFLKEIKANYQLSDIEIYPRVYPFLKQENATIFDVDFKKYRCEEDNINFFVFNIKGNVFIDTNYDDTEVTKIDNDTFKTKYGNYEGLFNLKDKTFTIKDNKYELKELY